MEVKTMRMVEFEEELAGRVRTVTWSNNVLAISDVDFHTMEAIVQFLKTVSATEVRERAKPPAHQARNGNGSAADAPAPDAQTVKDIYAEGLVAGLAMAAPPTPPPPPANGTKDKTPETPAPAEPPKPSVEAKPPEPPPPAPTLFAPTPTQGAASDLPYAVTHAERILPILDFFIEKHGAKTVDDLVALGTKFKEHVPFLRAVGDFKTRVLSTIDSYEPLQSKVTGWQT